MFKAKAVAVLSAMTLFIGCGGGTAITPAELGIINEYCPILGHEVDATVTTEWNGKKVGFCCKPCIPKWNELSEGEKSKHLADAASGAKKDGEHDG